jgi:hypothetical protein
MRCNRDGAVRWQLIIFTAFRAALHRLSPQAGEINQKLPHRRIGYHPLAVASGKISPTARSSGKPGNERALSVLSEPGRGQSKEVQ